MQISRRDALMGAGAAAVVAGVPGAVRADYLQIEYIQALVTDLRNVFGDTPMCVCIAFQETADRLETFPGIEPVACEWWQRFKGKPSKRNPIGPYLTSGRAGP